MHRIIQRGILLMLALLLLAASAGASAPALVTVPHVLRPGKAYDIIVYAPKAGMLSMALEQLSGEVVYEIYRDYPATVGDNRLHWDGLRKVDAAPVTPGDYILRASLDGEAIQTNVRIGTPYPLLTQVYLSDAASGEATIIEYEASEAGSLHVTLYSYADQSERPVETVAVQSGAGRYIWDRSLSGQPLSDGEYALILKLRSGNGGESMTHSVPVRIGNAPVQSEVQTEATQLPDAEPAAAAVTGSPSPEAVQTPLPTPTATQEPTPEPTPEMTYSDNPPYSSVDDGSYWAMTPGEVDDAAIWEIMMQPITVYDGGLDPKDHVYLMENPDGTGAKLAQVHGQSQGLHVIGEPNEHGYVLVEVFSSYDDVYYPKTDEEKERAFELRQGYVKAKNLKQIEVETDMGLLIDKLTQRMYLFVDGKRETELLLSTGIIADGKYYYETTVGEFITVSHTGGFGDKYMYCDMAIRINGGILIHEVPHQINRDESKNYKPFEPYLGYKASHGCVRIQREKNPEGYNHRWLWENLKKGKPYKVLIWDDLGRYDTPTTWQETPAYPD